MGTAASAFLNPIAAELEVVGPKPTAKALSRRAKQRRQIQALIGVSYVIDAYILLLYAHAGTIPVTIGPAFAACGLVSIACYIALSEMGFTERFKDHYFVAPQSIASMAIMLAFTYIAPEVGVMFLCTLFVVFNFSSLRSTPWQTAIVWTAMALGLTGLFLLSAATSVVRSGRDDGPTTAAEAMSAPISIEPDLSISRFVDEVLPLHRQTSFPVAHDRRLLGILALEDLKKLPRELWRDRRARDVMRPVSRELFVSESAALAAANDLVQRNGVGAVGVIDNRGRLAGFLQRGRVKRKK